MKMEQFKQDVAKKQESLNALQEGISVKADALKEKMATYKQALMENREADADAIFPEIERLKTEIKRDEQKARTLADIYKEQEQEQAREAFAGVVQVKADYQTRAEELNKKAKPLMDKLRALQDEAEELDAEYRQERDAYLRMGDQYGFRHQELSGISPYSGLQFGVWLTTKPQAPQPVRPKREKKPLPPNPTLKDLAEHNRII